MINLKSLITPTAVAVAFAFTAAPTFAQQRPHGGQGGSGQQQSGQAAQPRNEGQRPQAGAAPRVETRQEAPRAQPQPQARPAEAPRAQQREGQAAPRAQQQQQQRAPAPRGDYRRSDGDSRRGNEVGRAVPRREVIVPRGNVYAPRYSPRYSPRVYAPRSYYRPYVFRPRYSIGFGIYSGYPVPYTYSYPYPIEVYGYGAPRSEVMITPGVSAYGGVALEITPYDADVWVDGEYAGKVQDFDGTTQPLTLTPGTHRVEVQAPGYEPMTVHVAIQAGQVIPYRGDLRPY